MSKRILVIHDYNEKGGVLDPPLKQYLQSNGYRCNAPTINYAEAPSEMVVQVLLKELHEHAFDGIAGTGLGAFYAILLSKARDLPILAVNPLVVPGLQLPKFSDNLLPASRLKEFAYWEPGLLDLPEDRIVIVLGDSCSPAMELAYAQLLFEGCRIIWVEGGTQDIDTLDLGYIIHKNPDIFACPDSKLNALLLQ